MLAGVVLPGELCARAHLKLALFAAQRPDDLAGSAVELVERPSVTRGDEQVPVRQLLNRVDVQVVVRLGVRLL